MKYGDVHNHFLIECIAFILGLLNLCGLYIIFRKYINEDLYPISWKGWIWPLVCGGIGFIINRLYIPPNALLYPVPYNSPPHELLIVSQCIIFILGFVSPIFFLVIFLKNKIERFLGVSADIPHLVGQDSFIGPPPDHVGDMTCVVCNENESVRATYYVCGHYFACERCFYEFTTSNHKRCPRCRKCRIY